MEGKGEINMYTPFDFDSFNLFDLLLSGGLDFSFNSLYAALPWLDMGLDIENIPVVPSKMRYRSSAGLNIDIKIPDIKSSFWTPADLATLDPNDIRLDFDWIMETSKKTSHYMVRPVRLQYFLLLKPFNSYLLILQPAAGFSVNTVISDFTFNYGLSAQLNLPDIFSLKAGIKYFEELYNQSVSIELDYGFFEIDFAIGFAGQDFAGSFSGRGFRAFLGIKFGR